MIINLINRDALIESCENTIKAIEQDKDMSEDEVILNTLFNQRMIETLEACKPIVLSFNEEV